MTNEHEQRLHEQLCAYVLGEATSEERAEIERELLRSPELRAQRDTIERTIGLVKTAMGKGETLSPEAAETLYSAASSSKPRAWKSSGFLRLAAGIGAVALGFAIVNETTSDRASEVACLDDASNKRGTREFADPRSDKETPAAAALRTESARALDRNDASSLGITPEGVADARKNRPQEKPADVAVVMTESELLGFTGSGDKAQAAEAKDRLERANEIVRQQHELDRRLRAGGYAGSAPKQEAAQGDLGAMYVRDGSEQLGKKVEELYVGQRLTDTVTPTGSAAPSAPAAGPSTGGANPAGRVVTSYEEVDASKTRTTFDEYKASKQDSGLATAAPSTSPPPPPAGTKSKEGGTYRGAGDTVPPGGGGGGGAGSSGPGLSSPATPARKGDEAELSRKLRVEASKFATTFEGLGLDDDSKSVPYYKLPPAEQQIYLERQCRLILDGCVRRPNEKPRDMYFRFWGDNPFEVTALDPQSTFAADVDTASYALARRYLNEGNVPEKAQIRTEEFVNYFKSDVPAPKSGVFGIHTDLAPSRYSTDTTKQMLRVVVRGKDLSKVERPRMNLTFVVDVSGSMREQMRLEMVKTAIRLLVTQLDPYDKIGIVKFSTDASVVLPLTNISERALIEMAIEPLRPDGSTNSNAGLELGYGMALGGLDKEATNRVVFLSDGVANVGETDPAKIAERVKPMREKGIYLNTIGVGMNNHNDVLLEQLANKADGMCAYIDTADEAKKQLVDNFSGAFQPIARDVKIQVEFDPTQVLRYRLLGYENRAIADADFRNDKVDAGELGAGHQVTALYEIERQGTPSAEKPLATVRVRWKDPSRFGLNAEADAASEITHGVAAGPASTFEGAGQSYRKAVMAAQFAEILRRSVHARGDSLDTLLSDALKLSAEIPSDKDFTEFVTLVSKSKDLILRTMPDCDELCQAIDEVRESHYRRAQLAELQKELDQKTLDELKRQNDVLEAKLRELVRRRLENRVR